jgi:hypothetical protein
MRRRLCGDEGAGVPAPPLAVLRETPAGQGTPTDKKDSLLVDFGGLGHLPIRNALR